MGTNKSSILERKEIIPTENQKRLIASGWGEDVLKNTVTEKITYRSDGLKVKGYISYPSDKSQRYPCIIWNRGGIGNKGAIDSFTARGIYGQLASWGYVVFASQYRGNDGGEGTDRFGGDDVNDVLNLIPLADEIENADADRWGMEGWSRGGMMTYLTLANYPDFECAVLVGAISDTAEYVLSNNSRTFFYRNLLGEKEFEKKLEARTALNFADRLPKIPYLILHGRIDETVPVEQSIRLAEKLKEPDYNCHLELFEQGDHYLKKYRKEVDGMRRKWFEKYLKPHS